MGVGGCRPHARLTGVPFVASTKRSRVFAAQQQQQQQQQQQHAESLTDSDSNGSSGSSGDTHWLPSRHQRRAGSQDAVKGVYLYFSDAHKIWCALRWSVARKLWLLLCTV